MVPNTILRYTLPSSIVAHVFSLPPSDPLCSADTSKKVRFGLYFRFSRVRPLPPLVSLFHSLPLLSTSLNPAELVMATPSLRRRSSQITFVNDPDTQVAEAGHLARTFVDDEMRKADTDMKELLENIVKAAVDKGDDEAFMKKWEADWLALWNDPRCSRTKKAFEDISRTYNDHGPRHTFRSIPGELRSRLKYKVRINLT